MALRNRKSWGWCPLKVVQEGHYFKGYSSWGSVSGSRWHTSSLGAAKLKRELPKAGEPPLSWPSYLQIHESSGLGGTWNSGPGLRCAEDRTQTSVWVLLRVPPRLRHRSRFPVPLILLSTAYQYSLYPQVSLSRGSSVRGKLVGSYLSANVSGVLVTAVVQAAMASCFGILYRIIIDICDIVGFFFMFQDVSHSFIFGFQ